MKRLAPIILGAAVLASTALAVDIVRGVIGQTVTWANGGGANMVATFGATGGGTVPAPFEAWSYRRSITIDHTAVSNVANPSETYTNFPLLVSATGLANIAESGADIRFADAAGNELPREIESYTNGTLVAWVRATLTKDAGDASDDTLWMYYGNSTATAYAADAAYGSQSVWGSAYAAVWHFADTYGDSTANGNTLSVSQGAYGAGRAGRSIVFGSNQTTIATVTLTASQPLTISVWHRHESPLAAYVFDGISSGSRLAAAVNWSGSDTNMSIFAGSALQDSHGWASGSWELIAIVFDGASSLLFRNAALSLSGDAGANGLAGLTLGNRYSGINAVTTYIGAMDEFRVSSVARSAPWIALEYTNQVAPQAVSVVGAEATP
jgi:hypothetical protein